MEKLPLGERPFQARHERARWRKAQQSPNGAGKAAVPDAPSHRSSSVSRAPSLPAALGPRRDLRSGFTGAPSPVWGVPSGRRTPVLWPWPPRCLCRGAGADGSTPRHPRCSREEKRDPQRAGDIFSTPGDP